MTIGISIIVTFLLVLANGYFSAAEMALVNARRTKLQADADEGDKRALRALQVQSNSDDLLATIQVFITLLGFFASAAAATTLSDPLAGWIKSFDIAWLSAIAPGLSTVLITLAVSYVSIVLGELLPKRMALAEPEKMSKSLCSSIAVFQRIAAPLVRMTSASSSGLARLLHVHDVGDRQNVSEEEIKYIVKDTDELLPDEKRMIHEIIDMGDTTAHEIMTPRADIMFVEDTETVKQALDRMRGTGYSRLPVFHEDYDRIVGVVKYKDLVPALMDDRDDAEVGDFAKEAYFVPETKDIFPMLSEMQTSRQQMAIVVDEYGGTDGLITIEDIVEEIVGEIIDETDLEDKHVTRLTDGEWLVDGSLPVEDAAELGWPVIESEEYETVAGWLIDMVDTIPQIGDDFDIDGYRFSIQSMRRHRISMIRVKRLGEPSTDGAEPLHQSQDDTSDTRSHTSNNRRESESQSEAHHGSDDEDND
ncbi:MAG: hemolysin family protein [Eggerthellaceae bacterium]|jgi:putative hemolysin|nr:hemolysin family protein [Eggerthellaceae bacterium]